MGRIIVCLALLLTSASPTFAAYGLLHPHGVAVTDAMPDPSGSAHRDHVSDSEAAEIDADRISETSDVCLGGEGVHCGAAVVIPARGDALLRLPRHAGVRLPPDVLGPHRTPETEAPPPRV